MSESFLIVFLREILPSNWILVNLRSWSLSIQELKSNLHYLNYQDWILVQLQLGTLVENYVKKELQSKWVAILLICKLLNNCIFVFWLSIWNFSNLGVCNIPLVRSWRNTSNDILHAPKTFKILVKKWKWKIWNCLATTDQAGQKNCIRFWLRFFWA